MCWKVRVNNMEYVGSYRLTKKQLDYYNELLLLDLDDCLPYYNEEDIERLNAKKDDYISIACVEFDNGNYLTIDLASGSSNYYDSIVLWDKNGNELMCLDCDYNLGNFEFEYENDTYHIYLVINNESESE